jgi:hypothetical protein
MGLSADKILPYLTFGELVRPLERRLHTVMRPPEDTANSPHTFLEAIKTNKVMYASLSYNEHPLESGYVMRRTEGLWRPDNLAERLHNAWNDWTENPDRYAITSNNSRIQRYDVRHEDIMQSYEHARIYLLR